MDVLMPQLGQTVAEAVALMRQHKVGCVLVCEDQRLVGIFTERDLLRRVLARGKPLGIPLSTCMTPGPVVVYPTEPVSAALPLDDGWADAEVVLSSHSVRPPQPSPELTLAPWESAVWRRARS